MKQNKSLKGRLAGNLQVMIQARNIMGPESFFGPDEIKRALGIEIKPQEIPPIGFCKKELERAKELGQLLILRADKAPDGEPLTIKKIVEIKNNQTADGGKLLYTIGQSNCFYRDKYFFTSNPIKLSWALVSAQAIAGTNGSNYLVQTERLADYIKSKVFKNRQLPKGYQEAFVELDKEKAAIDSILEYDWPAAAAKLENLKITQLFRRDPTENIYDNVVVIDGLTGGMKLLGGILDWSKERGPDGGFLRTGNWGAIGATVCSRSPAFSSVCLGVCLSRKPSA